MSPEKKIAIAGCAVGALGLIIGVVGMMKASGANSRLDAFIQKHENNHDTDDENLKKKFAEAKAETQKQFDGVDEEFKKMRLLVMPDVKMDSKILDMINPRVEKVDGRINGIREDILKKVEEVKNGLLSDINKVQESVDKLRTDTPGIARDQAINQLRSRGL